MCFILSILCTSKKILSLGIGLFLEHIMDNFIKKIDGKQ